MLSYVDTWSHGTLKANKGEYNVFLCRHKVPKKLKIKEKLKKVDA